jgi:hypothetical protein
MKSRLSENRGVGFSRTPIFGVFLTDLRKSWIYGSRIYTESIICIDGISGSEYMKHYFSIFLSRIHVNHSLRMRILLWGGVGVNWSQ